VPSKGDSYTSSPFNPTLPARRNCIGTYFAIQEAVLVLATALQTYRLDPPTPGAPFPTPKPLITLRPESVPLRIRRR